MNAAILGFLQSALLVGVATVPWPAIGAEARGRAVCIGLTRLDPAHYANDKGELKGCDNDAKLMLRIAADNFKDPGKLLLNEQATRDEVLGQIRAARSELQNGDIFMISFSGHGGQIPDEKADAANKMDQTWCLFNGELLDKELYAEWAKFPPEVRILVFSDSCHSEGITKAMIANLEKRRLRNLSLASVDSIDSIGTQMLEDPAWAEVDQKFKTSVIKLGQFKQKTLNPLLMAIVYEKEKDRYDRILATVARPKRIDPLVLSISACLNEESAADADGGTNSVFTWALGDTWQDGVFQGDYKDFHKGIAKMAEGLNSDQHAFRRMIDRQDEHYWSQRPFSVAP